MAARRERTGRAHLFAIENSKSPAQPTTSMPPEKFSGGFSDRDIKRFSSPDLPDPHHHAPPLATTVVTSIPPPSSTPSPSSSHHSPHPPPHRNRHQHQYHLHHHGCHAANTIITTHARHAPPPPCSHLEGAFGFSASTTKRVRFGLL
ncbi:hypothetical protein Tco_1368655 [Tanacetum coccineum]